MKFVSVDIECNQPSGTIIQIGASVWDTQANAEVDDFNLYIQPNEVINWEEELRGGITLGKLLPYGPEKIKDHGVSPKFAFERFWKFMAKSGRKKVIQWGAGDMAAITKQSWYFGVPVNNRLKVLNAKLMYQMLYQPTMRLQQKFGLGAVIKEMGLEFEGEAHDGYWDAYNTGKLYTEMFRDIEVYREIKKLLEKK